MDTVTLKGYTPRNTENSIALVKASDCNGKSGKAAKPFYIPRKKIAEIIEIDGLGRNVRLEGENISRVAIPVTLEVDESFLAKLRIDPVAWM